MKEPFLNGKTILVISPQAWGTMLLSKHHYALELAKRGNQVYFLNPPDNIHWNLKGPGNRLKLNHSELNPNLFLINQVLYFPYFLKFHARWLYNQLIKKQITDIQKWMGKPIDIIWSFDIGNLFPIQYFQSGVYKLFHPVDEPGDEQAIRAAIRADIIFSVTREISDKYKGYPVNRFVINHGLAEEFSEVGNEVEKKNERIQTGMSGNLLRTDLDRETLLQIVKGNPEVDFHFFGSYKSGGSNISGTADAETEQFLKKLAEYKHVYFHGVLKTKELAVNLNQMDILLICYDIEKDQSRGTNYHKVMEYLSTGKVIVSNNITAYNQEPDLVRMAKDRNQNKELISLFYETVLNLNIYNDTILMQKRKNYALNNTYRRQLDTINEKIESGSSSA